MKVEELRINNLVYVPETKQETRIFNSRIGQMRCKSLQNRKLDSLIDLR